LRTEAVRCQKQTGRPRHADDVDDTTASTLDVDRQHGRYDMSILHLLSNSSSCYVQLTVHNRTDQSMAKQSRAARPAAVASLAAQQRDCSGLALAVVTDGSMYTHRPSVELLQLLDQLDVACFQLEYLICVLRSWTPRPTNKPPPHQFHAGGVSRGTGNTWNTVVAAAAFQVTYVQTNRQTDKRTDIVIA